MIEQSFIDAATCIDLFDFVHRNFPDDCKISGDWMRISTDPSINLKRGDARYTDFSRTGKEHTGSSIDLMMRHYGMTFPEAVEFINSDGETISPSYDRNNFGRTENKDFRLPMASTKFPLQTVSYLTKTRRIPIELVKSLMDRGLIYQSDTRRDKSTFHNIVFKNRTEDFAEIHGTLTFGKAFHGIRNKYIDSYWDVRIGEPKTIFITEASIDAISLFALHVKGKEAKDRMYVALGGVSKYQTVDRIRKDFPDSDIVIAVDNDEAGQRLRDRYPDFHTLIPTAKDWNDDLKAGYTAHYETEVRGIIVPFPDHIREEFLDEANIV